MRKKKKKKTLKIKAVCFLDWIPHLIFEAILFSLISVVMQGKEMAYIKQGRKITPPPSEITALVLVHGMELCSYGSAISYLKRK